MAIAPPLTPELDVEDLDVSLQVYIGVFGFKVLFERPEERFACLELEGTHLMLEQAAGPGRRFRTLEKPYGRGVNLQIRVSDVVALYDRATRAAVSPVIPLEERWYLVPPGRPRTRQPAIRRR
jgi:hypothetical protein